MMKTIFVWVCLAALGLLAGCVSAGQAYVKKHAELSPEHRKMILTGKVPAGEAVAGMTKEEVRLAMGKDPAQFTTIDGVYAWVYANEKGTENKPEGHHRGGGKGGGGGHGGKSSKSPDETANQSQGESSEQSGHGPMQTTIFFNGDRATKVVRTESGM
jgi:hypothetical protein